MRTTLCLSVAAALSSALLTAASAALAGDAYDDAMASSLSLERRGDLAGAARELEIIEASYPQDYALVLRLGWLHYRAEHDLAAEHYYRAAVARSHGAPDARLGLAWTLARQGRCDKARAELQRVLADAPDHRSARDGLARCAREDRWTVTTDLGATAQLFQGSDVKSRAAGVTLGARITSPDGWFLRPTLRATYFSTLSQSSVDPWSQEEVYLEAGYGGERGGVSFQYAFVNDATGVIGASHHAGISARFSPFGDLLLNGAVSLYDDMTVFRVEPSWRLPLTDWLSVRPGVALQHDGSEALATGMLTASLDGDAGSLFAGGKYGDEVRPARLDLPVVYNIEERVKFGIWAGASLNLGEVGRIQLSYSMDRLESASEASAAEASAGPPTAGGRPPPPWAGAPAAPQASTATSTTIDAHAITLGLSRTF